MPDWPPGEKPWIEMILDSEPQAEGVTQEMREAGAYELAMFNSEYTSYEDGAEGIFQAMVAAAAKNG